VAALRQYDRGVGLTVYPPQDLGGAATPPIVINARPPLPGVPAEPQLWIQASVTNTLSPAPKTATIRILGLSQTTRDTIAGTVRSVAQWLPPQAVVNVDGVLRPGGQIVTSTLAGMAAVILEAGWGGALQEVFRGTATSVRSRRQGPDWITEIQATDGGFQLAKAVASKQFAPGTTSGAVLAYLATTLGLDLAPTQGLAALQGFVLVGGLSCVGDCAAAIQDMCDALRLLWWVEDGQIWILGEGESLPGQPLVVSPEPLPNAIRLYQEAEPIDGQGLRIRCALASALRCGHLVALASSEQRGTYRVEAVEHAIDNRSGDMASAAVLRLSSPI